MIFLKPQLGVMWHVDNLPECNNPENPDRILIAKKIQILQNDHIAFEPFATAHSPVTHTYGG
jgi:hypothetical protein